MLNPVEEKAIFIYAEIKNLCTWRLPAGNCSAWADNSYLGNFRSNHYSRLVLWKNVFPHYMWELKRNTCRKNIYFCYQPLLCGYISGLYRVSKKTTHFWFISFVSDLDKIQWHRWKAGTFAVKMVIKLWFPGLHE